MDAEDGKIRSKETDIEDDFVVENVGNSTISEKEATDKIIEQFPDTKRENIDIRIELDQDDGKLIYEGTAYLLDTRQEYEFEINATNGHILKLEEDRRSRLVCKWDFPWRRNVPRILS